MTKKELEAKVKELENRVFLLETKTTSIPVYPSLPQMIQCGYCGKLNCHDTHVICGSY